MSCGAAIGALAVVAALPGSAQAASVHANSARPGTVYSYYADCSTTGAYGYVGLTTTTNNGPSNKWSASFEIKDTLADGKHAQARLVTTDATGHQHDWSWHYNTSGNGVTVVVDTTAQDTTNGIVNLGIEVARGSGSTVDNTCTNWVF